MLQLGSWLSQGELNVCEQHAQTSVLAHINMQLHIDVRLIMIRSAINSFHPERSIMYQIGSASKNSNPSWRKIDNLFDAIYYFSNDSVASLLERGDGLNVNECSTVYNHTPLIACIHWNNYTAAKLLLQHDHINVNKCEANSGWSPLHECVRFGRDAIAKLLIQHPDINLWVKSYENELPLEIVRYLGHDKRCESLIQMVQRKYYKKIREAKLLPDAISKVIVVFIY
eukprot:610939_1